MKRCYHCMHLVEQDNLQTCPRCGRTLAPQPVEPIFLRPGMRLQGKYLIGYPLGSGGFGNTYIGWNEFLDRRVAIKEFYPKQVIGRTRDGRQVTIADQAVRARFQKGLADFIKEAKNLASVKDIPGVVEVQAFFEENGTGYMVMEYLEGMDVQTALKQAGGKMDYERSREILLSVLYTLRRLHERGMLHRDISPDNIFLTKGNVVKLIDFGAARQTAALEDSQTQILLKSGYAPIEQYSRNTKQGPYTDLYAAAATFYRMVTGQKPIPAIDRVDKDGLIPPSSMDIRLPEQAELGIMVCLNVKSEYRLQSAEELMEALDGTSFVPRLDAQEKHMGDLEETSEPERADLSHPKKIGIAAAGTGLLALAAFVAVLSFGRGASGESVPTNGLLVMSDFTGLTVREAQMEMDELQEEAQKQGIDLEIEVQQSKTVFDLKQREGTIASQNIQSRTVLYDPEVEIQNEIEGLRREEDGSISGTVQCTVYSQSQLTYEDISSLNAYQLAKKLGIDTEDTKHFVGKPSDSAHYYDLIALKTPEGEISASELKKKEKEKQTISYQEGGIVVVYANTPFFYSEALPDFLGSYGSLSSIPVFASYIWKDENTVQESGEKRRIEEFEGMVDSGYCTVARNSDGDGYKVGDIIEQTVLAGTKLDMSREKLEQPLLRVIGEKVTYGGKTGKSFEEELKEKCGDNITVVAAGSGVMSQPVVGVVITGKDGGELDYFHREDPVTVTLSLQAPPAPSAPRSSTGGSSTGGVYIRGGSTGGSSTGDVYIRGGSTGGGSSGGSASSGGGMNIGR